MTAICLGACAVLVRAEQQGDHKRRALAKLTASAAFLAVAAGFAAATPFTRWMFAGLVLGAIGDMALLWPSKRAFLGGLVAFLLGHLAYVVGIAQIETPGRWLADAGFLALIPLAIGLAVLAMLWRRLGSLRLPVVVYVAAIVAMVVAALAAWRAHALPAPQCNRLALGAALFFVSDLAVARDRFVARAFVNRLWGLPAYYVAQLLVAWALAS